MNTPHPAWVYAAGATHVDELRDLAREVEGDVEFWAGVAKQLGRDIEDFCRDCLKEAKRRSKALRWLRRYWLGETGADTLPAELADDIGHMAWRVINSHKETTP